MPEESGGIDDAWYRPRDVEFWPGGRLKGEEFDSEERILAVSNRPRARASVAVPAPMDAPADLRALPFRISKTC